MSFINAENDPNELKICPYDPVHRVSAKRFPYHLAKCRKVRDANVLSNFKMQETILSNLRFIKYLNEVQTVWLKAQNVFTFVARVVTEPLNCTECMQ